MRAVNIKHFFDKTVKIVFMFRNLYFLKYIKKSQNKIVYFPDYDAYGIKIYETEILKYNQNVALFVAPSFESDLSVLKSKKRYFEDLASKYGNYIPVTKMGQLVLERNKKYQRVLPQEFYSVTPK